MNRVRAALEAAGLAPVIRETEGARSAAEAAAAIGCALDQIAKSIVFRGAETGRALLFLTAGGHRVDPARAAALVGEPLARADAGWVRAETGFAIGGVAPVGHLRPPRGFFDPRLLEFAEIWAAAGTPTHVFAAEPSVLQRITGAEVADFTSPLPEM